jgi:sec-independent protein translocase protein TatA
MGGLGPTELIIILVIVLLIFGAGRLAEVGGALGKGIREFRKATTDELEEPAAKPEANAEAKAE